MLFEEIPEGRSIENYADPTFDLEEIYYRKEMSQRIADFLQSSKLTARQCEAFLLKYAHTEDHTYAEIGALQGITSNGAKVQSDKALRAIRKNLCARDMLQRESERATR